MHMRVHLRIAGQVLVESCAKVLLVTVPCEFGRVDMIQLASQADVVDLPIPWPLEMAWRIGPTASSPLKPRRAHLFADLAQELALPLVRTLVKFEGTSWDSPRICYLDPTVRIVPKLRHEVGQFGVGVSR